MIKGNKIAGGRFQNGRPVFSYWAMTPFGEAMVEAETDAKAVSAGRKLDGCTRIVKRSMTGDEVLWSAETFSGGTPPPPPRPGGGIGGGG